MSPIVKRELLEQESAQKVLSHWNVTAPEDRMAHLVKDASKAFLRQLQLRLAEHDSPLGHWMYLRILWEKDGLTKRELSVEVGVMEPTAFVALKGMEEAGLVRFEKRDDNKKNIYVYLTDKGRGLRRQLVPLAEEVNAVAARGIAQEELQVTRKVLLQMLVNLNTQE